jgi:hypothetical protein
MTPSRSSARRCCQASASRRDSKAWPFSPRRTARGLIITLWDTEEGAADATGFGAGALERYMTLFRAPPGRDYYEVALAELPGARVD